MCGECFIVDNCMCCRVYLLQGAYPQLLTDLWDSYNMTSQSQNDRPGDIVCSYD